MSYYTTLTLGHRLSLFGTALFLTGCQTAVVRSTDANNATAGLTYALPKGQVILEASRTVVTAKMVGEAEKAGKDAADNVTAATKAKWTSSVSVDT